MSWELQKKFFEYFIDNKKVLINYFILSLIVGMLELTGIALVYPFINDLMNNISSDNVNLGSLKVGLLVIAAFLLKNGFMIFFNYLQVNFTKDHEIKISKKFMRYFLFSDYNNTYKFSYAKKNYILNFLPANVINNFLVRDLNLLVNIFVFSIIIGFLIWKFFIASIITFSCSIILIYLQSKFLKRKTVQVSNEILEQNKVLNQTLNESLFNLKNVKIINCENIYYNKYLNIVNDLKKNMSTLFFFNTIPPYITEPFAIILILILLAIVSIQNISEPSTLIASYAVISAALFRLTPIISRIQVNLTGIQSALPSVKELISLYEEFGLDKFNNITEQVEVKKFASSIEFKNIHFSYENDKEVLKNINLKINKGDFIGITGLSGVGKTTLLDILAGLLPVDKGELYLDDKLINSNKMPKLKIGYVSQEYNFPSESIREIVSCFSEEIDDEKVIKALKDAQLYDFVVNNLSNGINSNPFVDTVGLSQGQKQRLALARVLYTDPDIILLDEATSSLDLETENEICEVLNSLVGTKTIIAIAHRLSTIKSANKIVFMQNSTIANVGTFEDVYTQNPDFKTLVDLNTIDFIH